MRFFSDNAAPVCPTVLQAMAAANHVDTAYDGDALSQQLDARLSELFGRDVASLWVATGTATNCLALSLLCPPFGGILCHEEAHIVQDEGGAPEFYTHGARLMTCAGPGAKLSPAMLADRIADIRPDVHQIQPAAISITNATEYGLTYSLDELDALSGFARTHNLTLHMDGARVANAVAGRGYSIADMARGLDALSFGFTKNGGMNTELLVLFDPALGATAKRLRKRAGHLLSKGRYAAAQIHALLDDDGWLANARAANAAASHLAKAAGDRLLYPVEANELFLRLTSAEAASLRAKGFDFYDWGLGAARLVTSWHHSQSDIEPLAAAIRSL